MDCRANVGETDTNTMTAWWQAIASRLNWPKVQISTDHPEYVFATTDKGPLISGSATLWQSGELHVDLKYAEAYPETLDMALNASKVLVNAVVELATSNGHADKIIFDDWDVPRTSAEYARFLEEEIRTSYRTYDHFPTTHAAQVRHHYAASIWRQGTYSQCLARHQEWLATAPTQLSWLADQLGISQPLGWNDFETVSSWYTMNIPATPEAPLFYNPELAPLSAPGIVKGGPYSIDCLWNLDAVAHYLTVAIAEKAPHITWYIPRNPTAREMHRQPRLRHSSIRQSVHPMQLASTYSRLRPTSREDTTGKSLRAGVEKYINGN